MWILQFLFKNWFILIVLFIIVGRIFGRIRGATGAAPQQGRPSKGMPSFGGGPGTGPTSGREEGRARRMPATVQAQPTYKASTAPVMTRGADAPERASEAVPAATRTPQPIHKAPAEAAADTASPAGGLGPLTAQDAARGVLWAEILGPPRAKRPYRR
ncbi:hypothetical protein [Paenibacillus cremeus]|uniref:Uncharacterized protein n=1 Tax=Paenibacillus cremeus TaxID=2163881 RepID=A0A559KBZ5_9BACL|nr:hypothetical protein [Paenibacillus cremeus]TVY09654.1 hypothetical protein FPZ49_13030 [Paenibacillus cremeus]